MWCQVHGWSYCKGSFLIVQKLCWCTELLHPDSYSSCLRIDYQPIPIVLEQTPKCGMSLFLDDRVDKFDIMVRSFDLKTLIKAALGKKKVYSFNSNHSSAQWQSRDARHIMRAAFLCTVSNFLSCLFDTDPNVALANSRCDLIRDM